MGGSDSSEWIAFDMGVLLNALATYSENFLFQHVWELDGGPLGKTSGCHQKFDTCRHFMPTGAGGTSWHMLRGLLGRQT